ncbi:hypothetical protein M501DRAFT_1031231 [Patellaria atrata CBS 101060]|uniref:Uncharacterized protein n=1 Tax=Patellaria atrata CBS 101060 TaxID=1346257 RepID=A0A9P4VR70_9PEZI|nr:hypothetical protein M501DRAFT_1031231 [Patellaria atrata CBS 101060]
MISRNKDRLYVALYHHKREGENHWALLASSKDANPDSTNRYHATNKLVKRDGTLKSTWEFEHYPLLETKNARLLVKVLIGKIKSSQYNFERSLERVPIVQDNPEWTCLTWIRNAMQQLARDKILSDSSVTDWTFIEAKSSSYAKRKKDEGRFEEWTETTPTYDLMAEREIVV